MLGVPVTYPLEAAPLVAAPLVADQQELAPLEGLQELDPLEADPLEVLQELGRWELDPLGADPLGVDPVEAYPVEAYPVEVPRNPVEAPQVVYPEGRHVVVDNRHSLVAPALVDPNRLGFAGRCRTPYLPLDYVRVQESSLGNPGTHTAQRLVASQMSLQP